MNLKMFIKLTLFAVIPTFILLGLTLMLVNPIQNMRIAFLVIIICSFISMFGGMKWVEFLVKKNIL